MGPVDLHVARLLARIPHSIVREVPGHGMLVSVPVLSLATGWNKESTEIHFLAPQGYPFAKPDCFWADEGLRLTSGALPKNTLEGNAMPGLGKAALWFSWHIEHWNASRDDLLTWVASIRERLSQAV